MRVSFKDWSIPSEISKADYSNSVPTGAPVFLTARFGVSFGGPPRFIGNAGNNYLAVTNDDQID